MKRARSLPLLLLASTLVTACGVPISAADLTMTPEATPVAADVTLFSQTTVSSPALDTRADPAGQRSLSALGLTPQASVAPLATATQGPIGTPTPAPTSTPTPSPTPFGTPPPTATPAPSYGDLALQAVAAVNKYRADSGRPPLEAHPALMAAAADYARVMAVNSWFNHTGPDGSQAEGRIARAGYPGRFVGETLTAGQGSAGEAVYAWIISPAHAAIVLSTAATDVGIGYFYNANDIYRHYWVLVTGVR